MKLLSAQLGWLNSTPEGEKLSRAEKYRRKNIELDALLPKCQAEHLVLLFYESGMVAQNMNGYVSLSYEDIWYWLDITERELDLWEKDTVLAMSREYVKYYHKGCSDSPHASLPYIPEEQSENLQNMFEEEQNEAWTAFLEE